MAKVLILKVGRTLPEILDRRGDYEDWIIAGLGLPGDAYSVVNVRKGERLPDPAQVDAVVVSGSHARVTDRADWSEATAAWLVRAVGVRIPILGICYGHQLLAHALGGEVADLAGGPEFGTVPMRLEAAAGKDGLLGNRSDAAGLSFLVQMSHTQHVRALPSGATVLGSTRCDPHAALAFGDRVWGLQFHPEFDKEINAAYARGFARLLRASGRDPEAVAAACAETPRAAAILRRFAGVACPFLRRSETGVGDSP